MWSLPIAVVYKPGAKGRSLCSVQDWLWCARTLLYCLKEHKAVVNMWPQLWLSTGLTQVMLLTGAVPMSSTTTLPGANTVPWSPGTSEPIPHWTEILALCSRLTTAVGSDHTLVIYLVPHDLTLLPLYPVCSSFFLFLLYYLVHVFMPVCHLPLKSKRPCHHMVAKMFATFNLLLLSLNWLVISIHFIGEEITCPSHAGLYKLNRFKPWPLDSKSLL